VVVISILLKIALKLMVVRVIEIICTVLIVGARSMISKVALKLMQEVPTGLGTQIPSVTIL